MHEVRQELCEVKGAHTHPGPHRPRVQNCQHGIRPLVLRSCPTRSPEIMVMYAFGHSVGQRPARSTMVNSRATASHQAAGSDS